jgi:hypothetical protein
MSYACIPNSTNCVLLVSVGAGSPMSFVTRHDTVVHGWWVQAARNNYQYTPQHLAAKAEIREVIARIGEGGEAARLRLAEEMDAAASEMAARLEAERREQERMCVWPCASCFEV